MLKIKLIRSYPKLEDGKRKLDSAGQPIIVFVYHVTGPKAELDRYKEVQEKNDVKTVTDEDGKVLYFTTNPCGTTGKLGISVNDKVYVDTTAMDLANSLMKNYGKAGVIAAREILHTGVDTESTEVEVPEGKLED